MKKTRPQCAECERLTEFLFPATRMVTIICGYRKGAYPYKPRIPVYRQFIKLVLVCQRCRPPSNLEILEMIEEGKYKGRMIETKDVVL